MTRRTVLHLEGGGLLSRRVMPHLGSVLHLVRPGETEPVPAAVGAVRWFNAPLRDPAITSRIDAMAIAMAHSLGEDEKTRHITSCTPI
jgi:hypothetical protein